MAELLYFQWQNEFLCKTIYPMRLQKLRDFLSYYKEVDLWAEYKNKDIAALKADVQAYESGQENARITEFKVYSSLRRYFITADARGHYLKYKPIDEVELAEINKMHQFFVTSWPKDIRGERSFIKMRIDSWVNHINLLKDWMLVDKTVLNNDIFFNQVVFFSPKSIVISMPCFAKQSAQSSYPCRWIIFFHFDDCLAPDFFLISIFNCSSATSINVFRAFSLSSASFNAFCKASFDTLVAVFLGLPMED